MIYKYLLPLLLISNSSVCNEQQNPALMHTLCLTKIKQDSLDLNNKIRSFLKNENYIEVLKEDLLKAKIQFHQCIIDTALNPTIERLQLALTGCYILHTKETIRSELYYLTVNKEELEKEIAQFKLSLTDSSSLLTSSLEQVLVDQKEACILIDKLLKTKEPEEILEFECIDTLKPKIEKLQSIIDTDLNPFIKIVHSSYSLLDKCSTYIFLVHPLLTENPYEQRCKKSHEIEQNLIHKKQELENKIGEFTLMLKSFENSYEKATSCKEKAEENNDDNNDDNQIFYDAISSFTIDS